MKEAIAHQLQQIAGGSFLRHGGRVDAGGEQGLPIVDLDAGHVIEAEHPPAAQLPHHRGDPDAGIIQELLAKPSRMFGLQPEIQFPQQHAAALPGDPHPIAAPSPAGMALHRRRHLLHHLQIQAEQPLQARTLHLEHHLAAAAQAGAVNLSEAGAA